MKHDFDWSRAPAPWNRIAGDMVSRLRLEITIDQSRTPRGPHPRPFKHGPLPVKGAPQSSTKR